jgi:ADP-heptose:LPS heptosyltransferase
MPVAVIGTQADRSECDEVARAAQAAKAGAGANLAGLTPLSVLPAVIAASAGVICCDSAVKFLAAATGRPCTVLIGPTRAERTGPYGPYGRVASAEIPCRGCLDRTCPHITCMQLIRPEDVIDAAVSMLREGPPPCRTASSFDA